MDGNGCSIGTHILSYKPKMLAGRADAGICPDNYDGENHYVLYTSGN